MRLFSRAVAWNRQMDKLDRAEAVALGIAEAFNPEADLIENCRRILKGEKDFSEEGRGVNLEVMTSLFGNVPLVEK